MHLLLYLKYWKSKLSGIYSTFIGGDISGNPDFLFIAGLEWWWSRLSLCHETKLQQLQTRGKPNHNARYPQTLRFMIGLPHFLAFISGGVTWATDGCIRHSNINPYHPCHPNHQISSKFTSSKPWSFRGILTFEFFRVSCSPACDSPSPGKPFAAARRA